MKENPILSIVIPSRNRQKYAIPCIQSLLAIYDNRIEIVVHDNSDTNELELYITKNINDNRLIYRYDSTPMSTVHNFNKAMELVNGEYLCFIGDDDGVNPEIVDAALWAKSNNVDAIVEKTRIEYSWPGNNNDGILYVYPFSGKLKKVNIKAEIYRFLNAGGVYYLQHDLARVYHGIVKKECFDKVNKELGYYFGGLAPDIFSSISISLVAENIVSIDYPLTIAGHSPASNQTHRTVKAKNIELKDAPHFRARGNYTWSKIIPPVYSGETIWAESSVKAFEAFKRFDLIESINKLKLVSYIALGSPQHEQTIIKNDFNLNSSFFYLFKFNLSKMNILFFKIFRKIFRKIVRIIKMQKTKKFNNIGDIEQASKIIQVFCKRNFIKKYLVKTIK